MTGAELAARRTAAAAVLADFKRDADDFVRGRAPEPAKPSYVDWAFRLSRELQSLLDITAPAGGYLTAAGLADVLDALAAAAEHKREIAAHCPDCDASPSDLCETCSARLERAAEYDRLAETLRSQA
jgi:hypothetical protein